MSASATTPADAIACIRAVYARWTRETTPAQMRADWDALFDLPVTAHQAAVDADGIPAEWIGAPDARADAAILYLHGGGFQIGSVASHRELMARLSAAAGVRVLGIDYRLAPEHRHPAQVEDACRALRWLLAQGLTPDRIALAGDSAGGGLALSALLAMQAEGLANWAAATLFSPWTDMALTGITYGDGAVDDPLNARPMLQAMARARLGREADPLHPLASPVHASMTALGCLPPLLVQVGEREIVRSDAADLVARVQAAGGRAQLHVAPGLFHVYQQFPGLPAARDAVEAAGRFLAGHLGVAVTGTTSRITSSVTEGPSS